jgi:hypothetical protein
MNRIQFVVLVGLSSLLVLFMMAHLYLAHKVGYQQATASALQQGLSQGRDIYQKLNLLARRINNEAQKTPSDQALKDILTHQQITIKNPDASSSPSSSDTSAVPAPTSTTAPTH